jgi:hypothetical protein
MIYLVERVTLGQVFLQVLPFSPVIFPPMLHTHLHCNITINRRTSGALKKKKVLSGAGELGAIHIQPFLG